MKRSTLEDFFQLPTEELNVLQLIGFKEVIINDDNSLSLVLETKKHHMNYHGSIQGGIQFMVCDAAIGLYLIHIDRLGVGMESSIHFYRSAVEGDTLTATVYERKLGKRVGTFLIELKNQNDVHIADVTYSIMFN